MHAVGFHHEHSRIDRDIYVEIKEENVISSQRENFEKKAYSEFNLIGQYDFCSIMHYRLDEFTRYKDRKTIQIKNNVRLNNIQPQT